MDTLRGYFSGHEPDDTDVGYQFDADDDIAREPPPLPVGQDERRMQLRAYNHWVSLLGNAALPSIEQLDPHVLPDFGPFSVLLNFTSGVENPAVHYLGDKLAEECAGPAPAEIPIRHLADVPQRSLLSRITDHYLQILANQAPIGFEAEFVNQRGSTVLYRGILLPYTSSGDTIDFIYGVINWKELADQQITDALLIEIDQALQRGGDAPRLADPITEWADGPVETRPPASGKPVLTFDRGHDNPLTGPTLDYSDDEFACAGFPAAVDAADAATSYADTDGEPLALADWLASARALARAASGSEDRSRHALYGAIGRAFDFSLAASAAPADFRELVRDAGLTIQDRAPMTPVVKLVFGGDYDKTRLTEYATALAHAHRLGLARGLLTGLLAEAPGGLKGVVASERNLKRAQRSTSRGARETRGERLVRQLRAVEHRPLAEVADHGEEFTVLVARRLTEGDVVLLGEVDGDPVLLERAARHLLS